jgi:Ser/Thr protein kinase RdoA (MazF antagonist)
MMHTILNAYGLDEKTVKVKPFGTGLINHTWLVNDGDHNFILQRINHNIFKAPELIAENLRLIGNYLSANHPSYFFVMPEKTMNDEDMIHLPGSGYYRSFNFVSNSHSIDVVNSTQQAFEAATQFGKFTRLLADFPARTLNTTLPDFHNLTLRYAQFEDALLYGDAERIARSASVIQYLKEQKEIADTFEKICNSGEFKQRVTHHDTKISNVLFDQNDNGLCVIDLDTVMPGYFISDVGDMMRTYLSPVNEEEKDFDKIHIRTEYFKAIKAGYLSEMGPELTPTEKDYFVYAGKFMIYMQALRFITDHINNDKYYGAAYEGQNFVRASNQVALLQKLIEKEPELNTA